MSANLIADLVFVLIATVNIIVCAKVGIINILVKWIKTAAAVFLAYTFGSIVGTLFNKAFFGSLVYDYVYEKIVEICGDVVDVQQIVEAFPAFFMSDSVKESMNSVETTAEDAMVTIANTISIPVARVISTIVGAIVVFFLSLILIGLFAKIISGIGDSVKAIRIVNHGLGALWGILSTFALLLILAWILRGFFGTEPIYTNSIVVKFFGDDALVLFFKIFNLGATWVAKIIQGA